LFVSDSHCTLPSRRLILFPIRQSSTAMPVFDLLHGPSNGPSTPKKGKKPPDTDRSLGIKRKATPPSTPSPSASISHGRNIRKRPSDYVVDANDSDKSRNKRLKVDVIDLTNEPDLPNLSNSKWHAKSSHPNHLDNVTSGLRPEPRYIRPLNPSVISSTPPPVAKKKCIVIDLTSDDSEDEPNRTPKTPKTPKTAKTGATGNFGLLTPRTPKTSGWLDDRLHQTPVPENGQARVTNSALANCAVFLRAPEGNLKYPKSKIAFRPGQLTDGSPGASEGARIPSKPAPWQETAEEVAYPNGSPLFGRERAAKQNQQRRGFGSASGGLVTACDESIQKIDGQPENGKNQRPVGGKSGARDAISIASDTDPEETGKLSHTYRFQKQWRPPSSAAGGANRLQETSGLANIGRTGKQSSPVVDAEVRLDDGDGRAGPSAILRLDIGRKQDPKHKQPPRTPNKGNRTLVVTLKGLPSHKLRRISQRPIQRPEIPLGTCFLTKMPLEIQRKIFEYLLLADDPIQVLHRWSKLYQRQRSGLHTDILRTCKVMFENGSAFLYGENVFRYLVRDRHQKGISRSFEQDIYVERYMSLFRKLELQIERSRTEQAYCDTLASAINLLNEHDAKLHNLAMDVSPTIEGDTLSTVGYFYQDGEVVKALKALNTCFITVRVFTPQTEDEPPARLRRVLDMRTEPSVFDQGPMPTPDLQLDDLCEMITQACESPSKVLKQGLFEEFQEVQRQNERRARCSRVAYSALFDDDHDLDDLESSDDDGGDDGDFEG
jgi:hypothetical protein